MLFNENKKRFHIDNECIVEVPYFERGPLILYGVELIMSHLLVQKFDILQ